MNRILLFLTAFVSFFSSICAQDASRRGVVVHNRILATVNGKSVSMMDVVKQLDLLFYQNYPDMRNNPEARSKFYKSYWKQVFRDLLDRELVLADAQEKQFSVSNGDVREEMEDIFGPDVIKNISNAGLTVQEVQKMIRSDILLRRMLFFRVKSRVYSSITPQEIEKAYEKNALDYEARMEVTWDSITFKSTDEAQSKKCAASAFELLTSGQQKPAALKEVLAESDGKNVTISFSSTYTNQKSELAQDLAVLFSQMEVGDYSPPIPHRGRNDPAPVWKIYHLNDRRIADLPPLADVEAKIREQLTQERVEARTREYIDNLRKHFGMNYDEIELQSQDYQPFD